MKRNYKILIILFIILLGILLYLSHIGITSQIGSNDLGTVTKTSYISPTSQTTIVLITGIHPREKLAIEPEKRICSQIASNLHVNVINYDVKVTKDAQDYKNSRANGEQLVADYIVPDINNSNANLVIISHSHIPGYGEGFYVATPEMDDASVKIAQSIQAGNIDFNYFPNSGNESYNSTSAKLVSKPLAQSGYPTLVYEIPENITEDTSSSRAYTLLEKSVEILQNS